jgi:hypothetical protein
MAINLDFTPWMIANAKASETRKDLGYALGAAAPGLLEGAWKGLAGWTEEGKNKGIDYNTYKDQELYNFWKENISGKEDLGSGEGQSFSSWKKRYAPTYSDQVLTQSGAETVPLEWRTNLGENTNENQSVQEKQLDLLNNELKLMTEADFLAGQQDKVRRGAFGAPGDAHSGWLFPLLDEEYQNVFKARKEAGKGGFGKEGAFGAYLYGPEAAGMEGEGHKLNTAAKIARGLTGLGAGALAAPILPYIQGAGATIASQPAAIKAALLAKAMDTYEKSNEKFDLTEFAEKKWGEDGVKPNSKAYTNATKFDKWFKKLKKNVLKPTAGQQLDKLAELEPPSAEDLLKRMQHALNMRRHKKMADKNVDGTPLNFNQRPPQKGKYKSGSEQISGRAKERWDARPEFKEAPINRNYEYMNTTAPGVSESFKEAPYEEVPFTEKMTLRNRINELRKKAAKTKDTFQQDGVTYTEKSDQPSEIQYANPEALTDQIQWMKNDSPYGLKDTISKGRGGINRAITPEEAVTAFTDHGVDGKSLLKRYIQDGLIKRNGGNGFDVINPATGSRRTILESKDDSGWGPKSAMWKFLDSSTKATDAYKKAVDLPKRKNVKAGKDGFPKNMSKKDKMKYFEDSMSGEVATKKDLAWDKKLDKIRKRAASKRKRDDNKKLVFRGKPTKITQKQYKEEFKPLYKKMKELGLKMSEEDMLETWLRKKNQRTVKSKKGKKKIKFSRKPKVKVRDTGKKWPFRYERI